MSRQSNQRRERDLALNELTSEFTQIPIRIVLDVFLSYLDRVPSVSSAAEHTRTRLHDACLAA